MKIRTLYLYNDLSLIIQIPEVATERGENEHFIELADRVEFLENELRLNRAKK